METLQKCIGFERLKNWWGSLQEKRAKTLRERNKAEEDCSESKELLIRNGYHLTLLNIVFGLLPVNLSRDDVRFSHFSLPSFYSWIFLLALCFVSSVFVKLNSSIYYAGLSTEVTTADIAINIAQTAHVVGFVYLMVKGKFIAWRYPKIWSKLALTYQKSIMEVHGKSYKPARKLRRISRNCVIFYLMIVLINEVALWDDFQILLDHFEKEYKTKFGNVLEQVLFVGGFIIWELTTQSHVLVSMILIYFLYALQLCLSSVNKRLKLALESFQAQEEHRRLLAGKAAIQVGGPHHPENKVEKPIRNALEMNETSLTEALKYTKRCYGLAELVMGELSQSMGFSIVAEVLILLGNVIANVYFLFVRNFLDLPERVKQSNNNNEGFDIKGILPDLETRNASKQFTILEPLSGIFCHAISFYWLAVVASTLKQESKKPIKMLRDVEAHNFSDDIQKKLHRFQSDIQSTCVKLSAGGYFTVDMKLLTSIFHGVLTFVVVLIQFKTSRTEVDSNDYSEVGDGVPEPIFLYEPPEEANSTMP